MLLYSVGCLTVTVRVTVVEVKVQMGSLWLSIEAFQGVPGLPQLTHSQDSAGYTALFQHGYSKVL